MATITLENFQERWSALEADLLKDERISEVNVGEMGGGTIYYSEGRLQDCVIEITLIPKAYKEAWETYLDGLRKGNYKLKRPTETHYYIGISPKGALKSYTAENFYSNITERMWPDVTNQVRAVCAEILKA